MAGMFDLVPSGAGRVVVVFHHDAFRTGQAAAVGNHTIVEHGRIPTGGHLIDDLNAVRRRTQQRPNPTGFRVARIPAQTELHIDGVFDAREAVWEYRTEAYRNWRK